MITDDDGQTGAVGATIIITEQNPICQADPVFILIPNSGPQGKIFKGRAGGFSFNHKAILHLQKENGQIFTKTFETNAEGKFAFEIDSTNLQPGTYFVWFEDRCTGKRSAKTDYFIVEPPQQDQAPQITSLDIPGVITIDTPTGFSLGFYDPNGDVNWIRWEELTNSGWTSVGEWDPQVSGQARGTITGQVTCRNLRTFVSRVMLRDTAGNSSGYYEYSYQCVSSGLPPAPPVNRLPTVTLTYWPQNPTPDDTVNFQANASDPDGDLLTYEWYLNGVVYQTGVTTAGVHWDNPPEGTHTMTVKVSDNKGGTTQASVTFTVREGQQPPSPPPPPPPLPELHPPVARFTIGGESMFEGYKTASENEVLYLSYTQFEEGVTVNFSAGNSFDPDGTIVGTNGLSMERPLVIHGISVLS